MSQSSNDIHVSVSARTDTGLRRKGNEDAFLIADLTTGNLGLGPDMRSHRIGERGSLLVVSDGMGGAAAGEVASEMAVKTVRQVLMSQPPSMNVLERLRSAAEQANQRVWEYAQQDVRLQGMGATLTAVLIQPPVAFIAQIGDSRAYLIRGERIKQLTKDQSLVQALLDAGAVSPGQVDSIPQNVITQALGMAAGIETEISSLELFQGDILILCSDGLSNKVKAEEMLAVTQQIPDLTMVCRNLVALANQRGGEDNITLVIARLDGEMLHSAADSNSITGSFRMLLQASVTKERPAASFDQAVKTGEAAIEEAEDDDLEPTTVVFNPLYGGKRPPTEES